MTDYLTAFILGLIQGFTEFLPISSSGHLEIAKTLLKDDFLIKESILLTVVLHGATAISTIVVFHREIFKILKDLLVFKKNQSTLFSWHIIISMFPATLISVFFEKNIEKLFNGNLILVGLMLFVTAIILVFSSKSISSNKYLNTKNAFIIGLAQAIAILPGISRSGSTIAMSLILGINKTEAAKFSFLMVVPLILGGMIKNLSEINTINNYDLNFLIIGFFTAFFSGLIACKWMIKIVEKSKLWHFSIYCLIIGSFSIYIGIS
ncbi:MAG: undecaprenyl-diphosphate phosphatase [Flavobacteriaceae bacterium]|nr:undecaprenyl-diphosphate phosphatase [Flavobacteriaceae bacterium]